MAYEVYCDYPSYNFRIFDDRYSKEVPFTEEEIYRHLPYRQIFSLSSVSKERRI